MTKKSIIYGKHSVKSVIQNINRNIEQIFCTEATFKSLQNELSYVKRNKISLVNRNTIEQVLQSHGFKNVLHQDIVVISQKLIQPSIHEIIDSAKFLILLDELQDSQNIGAIIRSAALLNVDAVVSTLHNSPDENPHIIKSACGAFEYIPFIKVINLSQTIQLLQENNFWVVGMSCNTKESIDTLQSKFSKNEKIALIVGNEEVGMRKLVEKNCDFLFKIPINISKGVDSLNASSAVAIFLYEINKIMQ